MRGSTRLLIALMAGSFVGCGEGGEGSASSPAEERPGSVLIFQAELRGEHVVPDPVTTEGSAKATGILNEHRLTVLGTFEALSSAVRQEEEQAPVLAIHIHQGGEDEAGAALFQLRGQVEDDGRSGTFVGNFRLSEEQMALLLNQRMYLDIHTTDHPAGEVRAQLRPMP